MPLKVYTSLYCKEALRKLDDFVDRELSPADIKCIETHLRVCKHCAAKFAFETELIEELKAKVRRISVPPTLLKGIMEAIESQGTG
jgi:anti-sigma factor (TIGR02949 family)